MENAEGEKGSLRTPSSEKAASENPASDNCTSTFAGKTGEGREGCLGCPSRVLPSPPLPLSKSVSKSEPPSFVFTGTSPSSPLLCCCLRFFFSLFFAFLRSFLSAFLRSLVINSCSTTRRSSSSSFSSKSKYFSPLSFSSSRIFPAPPAVTIVGAAACSRPPHISQDEGAPELSRKLPLFK